MTSLLVSVAIGACLLISSGGSTFAANPHNTGGTGPTGIPDKECGSANATGSPGHAASSPGAPFNEPTATSPGGKGGQAYNAAGAPSQYDVACFQTQVP